ncbi:MAG TPA: hypothetical protein VK421_20365 [Pyrinomonadaceae bacterium]|nr:hypothetical protein [Pyrinomonadaceae bacterium]
MRRKHLTLSLALCLLLTQARPAALAQSQPAAAPQQQPPATAQPQQPATPSQSQKPSPLDKRAAKVRRSVQRIGLNQTITVIMPKEDDLHGTVIGIGEQSFQLAEVDLRQTITVRYGDVKKVRSGYRPFPDLFTGQRNSSPKGMRLAALGAVIFMGVILPAILVGASKD